MPNLDRHFLGIFVSLVIFGVAGMLSACGSDVSPDTQLAPEASPEDGSSAIDDGANTNQKLTNKLAEEKPRLGGRLGDMGDVTGWVPVDVSTLSEAETKALAQARTVLAGYLKIPDADAAGLVEISKQKWPNSSLGCGQPGEMSAQVITEGYKVVLVLSGRRHLIHTGRRGGRVCERLQTTLKEPHRAISLSAVPRLQREARADLAAKLSVAESEITAGRVTRWSWPDASLGCPEPNVEYSPAVTGGYFLSMVFRGRTVQYRTDGKRVVVCEGLELLIPQEK